MLLPLLILAVVQSWTVGDSPALEAELLSFDFREKTVTLEDRDGAVSTVATAELSLPNRIQVLLSPAFVAGYPSDEWTPQQTRFVGLAVVIPAFYFLFAFWMAAAIFMKRASPVRALFGFGGGWLLSLLLVGTYVILGARIGQSVGVVLIVGGLIASLFVSVYVSAIYETTTWNGFRLFAFHVILAVCLMLISTFTVSAVVDTDKLDSLLTRTVFEPVGLLAQLSDSSTTSGN